MLSSQLAPGVYFEKVESGISPVSRVRMDIPGFAGICERGPVDTPLRINSLKEFTFYFGDQVPDGILAYSVRGFFDNGGQTCYVTRITDISEAACASKIIHDRNNETGGVRQQTMKITAINEGRWGADIEIDIRSSSHASTTSSGFLHDEPVGGYDSAVVRSARYFEQGSVVSIHYNDLSGDVKEVVVELTEVDSSSGVVKWTGGTLLNVDGDRDITFTTMEFDMTLSYRDEIRETFTFLSMNPSHSGYFVDMINGKSVLVTVEDLHSITPVPYNLPQLIKEADGMPDNRLKGGADGIETLAAEDFTGSEISRRGLATFESVDDITSLAVPDIVYSKKTMVWSKIKSGPCEDDVFESSEVYSTHSLDESGIDEIHTAMITQCEKLGDRVAVLDFPEGLEIEDILTWRKKYDSKYAFVYYPWIEVPDPLKIDETGVRLIPQSGHVLGIFAKSDAEFGVHKAPANEIVNNCTGLEFVYSDSQQVQLNHEGINCIRSFPGRGIRVWGARTLSYDPLWRYVNVRRLLIMIEKSIDQSTRWAVFEPNDFNLRLGLANTVTWFLREIWKEGGLTGATQDEAFVVTCSEKNNPSEVIDVGQVITDIQVAPTVPAEFITVRIMKTEGATEIIEV
jgi:phage tail sheath protein FI